MKFYLIVCLIILCILEVNAAPNNNRKGNQKSGKNAGNYGARNSGNNKQHTNNRNKQQQRSSNPNSQRSGNQASSNHLQSYSQHSQSTPKVIVIAANTVGTQRHVYSLLDNKLASYSHKVDSYCLKKFYDLLSRDPDDFLNPVTKDMLEEVADQSEGCITITDMETHENSESGHHDYDDDDDDDEDDESQYSETDDGYEEHNGHGQQHNGLGQQHNGLGQQHNGLGQQQTGLGQQQTGRAQQQTGRGQQLNGAAGMQSRQRI